MDEPEIYYLYFEAGDRQLCPLCVETMLEEKRMTFEEVGATKILPSEPWTLCTCCGLPVPREECVFPFERVMSAIYEFETGKPSPFPPPPDVAKANEKVKRLKREAGAVYRELAAARNKVIELTGRLDERPLPE